jgi:cobalt/nickel transport system permease protein
MSSIHKSMQQMTALEDITNKNTIIHRAAPSVKLIITVLFILSVVSFSPSEIGGLLIFACVPAFLIIIAEVPFRPLAMRCLIALPFAFFAGLSNLIISRDIIFFIGQFGVTEGMISFLSLMLKTILTVMSVLLLMATTSMNDLIYALINLHIPSVLTIQIMMTYRYLSLLLEEASLMYHAYLLRAPKAKGIKMSDMGSFLGQLILRSFDRAERIYHAMQCRGFEGKIIFTKGERIRISGWLTIILAGALFLILRLVRFSEIIGRWIS